MGKLTHLDIYLHSSCFGCHIIVCRVQTMGTDAATTDGTAATRNRSAATTDRARMVEEEDAATKKGARRVADDVGLRIGGHIPPPEQGQRA